MLGYIRKQVGRPWNKIYSELCANLDKRKLTHAHVFTHIFQYVGLHVVYCADWAYREKDAINGHYDDQGRWIMSSFYPEFYVHPKTGLLKKNKAKEGRRARKARLERERKYDLLRFKDGLEYRKVNDLWYSFRSTPCADPGRRPLPPGIKTNDFRSFWKEEKRQLSKKELILVREVLGKRA